MLPSVKNGMIVAAAHAMLLCGIAAKFSYDRTAYPRGWMKTMPVDPYLPLRGRYINLLGVAKMGTPPFGSANGAYFPSVPILLTVKNDQVFATQSKESTEYGQSVLAGEVRVDKPLAFFIPENAPDPSRLQPGEELWVEVTIPPTGSPRPIQLQKRMSPPK